MGKILERIDPKTLTGPRVYFTAFDHRIISQTKEIDKLKKTVERRLKILLLTKSKIVCAASHLSSQFSYEFFKDNAQLLTEGHIIPALRADKISISDIFNNKKLLNAKCFFSEHISKTITWQLEENSSWFRNVFLNEIKNPKSVIRTNLPMITEAKIKNMIDVIESKPLLGRGIIDNLCEGLSTKERKNILNYRELIYHISGAKIVNCESSLPQENYIDYDLVDINQKRTRLSDEMIFWKIFIELILESIQRKMISIELLDILTFDDIIEIRKPLLNSNFQQKYDNLIEKAIYKTNMADRLLLDINQLNEIHDNLQSIFKNTIKAQYEPFLKKKLRKHNRQIIDISSSFALGILSLFPPVSIPASIINLIKETPSLLINIINRVDSQKSIKDKQFYVNSRSRLLKKEIEMIDISDKSCLLDMVDMLTTNISMNIKI